MQAEGAHEDHGVVVGPDWFNGLLDGVLRAEEHPEQILDKALRRFDGIVHTPTAQKAIESALMDYIVLALTWLISTLAGSFLGAYLKKKGENFATHEDIDKLLEEVRAVTTTTKEIEAKISNEVWERQRRWEVKRDAVFEAVKELRTVQQSLNMVVAAYKVLGVDPDDDSQIRKQRDVLVKYYEAFTGFLRAKMLATIVCGKEVRDQFDHLEGTATLILNRATQGEVVSANDKFNEFVKGTYQLARMIREELQVDDPALTATSQSSGSSAAQAPDSQAPE